jgi:hypothetical protein
MSKLDLYIPPKTLKRFNAWKSDIRQNGYRSYLTVRQVNKVGRRHWLFCQKQRRQAHLLSDGELRMYTKLLWQPGCIKVMEQFALDIDETLDIAVAANLIHPRNWQTYEAYVMTTDFVVQQHDVANPSKIVTIAYTFKYFGQIYEVNAAGRILDSWSEDSLSENKVVRKNLRTWQKFAIEKEFWRRRGVEYRVVTERDATKEQFWNIGFCASSQKLIFEKNEICEFVQLFVKTWQQNFRKPLNTLITLVASDLNIDKHYALSVFKYAVLHHFLPLEHSSSLQPFRPLELSL